MISVRSGEAPCHIILPLLADGLVQVQSVCVCSIMTCNPVPIITVEPWYYAGQLALLAVLLFLLRSIWTDWHCRAEHIQALSLFPLSLLSL